VRTCVLVAAALALAGCAAEQRGGAADAPDPPPVYRLAMDRIPRGECDDASCTLVRWVVWVAPEPGWVRSETEDGTGFETTKIFAHDSLVTDHNDGPPDIRSGLASFVGQPPELPLVEAVRARETVSPGDRIRVRYPPTVTFIVEEVLALETPAGDDLFAIPDGGITSRTVEPGAPSALLDAYWLGLRYGDLVAVSAIERDAPNEAGYFVFYGHGPESAYALQITNQSVDQVGGRRTLAALEGREQSEVTLANGERARLVAINPAEGAYVVATGTTLVGFAAGSRAEAVRVAEALRPTAGS